MKGVQYLVDDQGRKKAVVIDLIHYKRLWEDFCDAAVAAERANEPRKSFDEVERRILDEQE